MKPEHLFMQNIANGSQALRIQHLPNVPQPVRPDLALMIAGYDLDGTGKPNGQRIYQLVSQADFAPMLHNYGFAVAGVAQYALYLLNRLYKTDSPVEQLKALAAYTITETASQGRKGRGEGSNGIHHAK
jgi:hypothetical protein